MTLLELAPRVAAGAQHSRLPVMIIGAGPIGLAAAAHLVERGLDFTVLERGPAVASAVAQWGHIRLFSPWRHLIDPASRRLLDAEGWTPPADEDKAPTGRELIDDYLAPLAGLPQIAPRIRYDSRAIAVTRVGMDRTRTFGRDEAPLLVRIENLGGDVEDVAARAVIDASGTYGSPNPLGSSGLNPLGASDVADRLATPLPDVLGRERARFAGRRVTVVGAGHSAANSLIALAELATQEPATRITWLVRTTSTARVSSSPDDELADRARLGSRVERLVAGGEIEKIDSFEIAGLSPDGDGVRIVGSRGGVPAVHHADLVINATGFRPDLGMLRELRLQLDDVVEAPVRLAPLIDPNVHSCGTVEPHGVEHLTHPESGFFIVGMKSYGRAPTFLLATGYEQVRSVTAWIDGDMRAAMQVQLQLPATGVCSTGIDAESACCS